VLAKVVCDAVVREWLHQLAQGGNAVAAQDLEAVIKERLIAFYADDGFLASRDPEWLQQAFNLLIPIFEGVGLKTNTTTTKAMNFVPGHIRTPLSDKSYRKRTLQTGLSHRKRQRRAVECPDCDKQMNEGSLPTHRTRVTA